MAPTLAPADRAYIRRWLAAAFSSAELGDVAFDLGIDRDDLRHDTRGQLALDLLRRAEREGRMSELIDALLARHTDSQLADIRARLGDGASPPRPGRGAAPMPGRSAGPSRLLEAQRYDNFDIRIGPPRDGLYPLTAESLEGETSVETGRTLPGGDEIRAVLGRIAHLQARREELEQVGERLGEFLLGGDVGTLMERSLTRVRTEGGAGLRIRLRLTAGQSALHRLPWELTRYKGRFVALSEATPFVRYIHTPQPPRPATAPAPIRILIATANPGGRVASHEGQPGYANTRDLASIAELGLGLLPLDVAREEARIREALAGLEHEGVVQVSTLRNASRTALRQRIQAFDPHVLHFAGHGLLSSDGQGMLVLESTSGRPQTLDSERLSMLVRDSPLRLVLLSACLTASYGAGEAIMGLAPRLVFDGLPAAVAMQFAVPDATAIAFMAELFGSLARGEPLDRAVTEARKASFVDGEDETHWAIPVLFMRSPDGLVWS